MARATPHPAMTLNCTWQDMMREAIPRLASAGIEHRRARRGGCWRMRWASSRRTSSSARWTRLIPSGSPPSSRRVQRRIAHEPLSRIRGRGEFYGRNFIVTPDVLDPRPETELLVEQGLKRLPPPGTARVLDLGTGTGCILLASSQSGRTHPAWPSISRLRPLAVAKRNAEALGRLRARVSSKAAWEAALAAGPFDLVLSNPPYVTEAEYEELAPASAITIRASPLWAGQDGLDPYRAILELAPRLLKPGGSIGFEFGSTQGEAVAALMARRG